MTEEEKIFAGLLFCPGEPSLKALKLKCHNLNIDYNNTYEDEREKRAEIIKKMGIGFGEGSFMQGPITFHYGTHTTIGKDVFINFNFTVQDDTFVTIGDGTLFGPNCTIVTPCHPMVATERKQMHDAEGEAHGYCYAKPVHVGRYCWIGANVVICPGVTIGDGCVIGAGAVVIRDIPSGVFAAGVPCKVIKEITEADSMKYMPDRLGDVTL